MLVATTQDGRWVLPAAEQATVRAATAIALFGLPRCYNISGGLGGPTVQKQLFGPGPQPGRQRGARAAGHAHLADLG